MQSVVKKPLYLLGVPPASPPPADQPYSTTDMLSVFMDSGVPHKENHTEFGLYNPLLSCGTVLLKFIHVGPWIGRAHV